ncbi:MAG: dihydroneopterin aldolase [Pseudomonadota bacterium]
MHDRIFLRDLRVETIIGIFEWERQTRQIVSIDLTMPGDIRRAAATDHIDDTFNYQAVAERVVTLTEGSSFQLVETLAEKIAELCLSEFGMAWIDVRVNKPGAVKGARDVGVMIHRRADDNEPQ